VCYSNIVVVGKGRAAALRPNPKKLLSLSLYLSQVNNLTINDFLLPGERGIERERERGREVGRERAVGPYEQLAII
jgi:hypothetical protein